VMSVPDARYARPKPRTRRHRIMPHPHDVFGNEHSVGSDSQRAPQETQKSTSVLGTATRSQDMPEPSFAG
jgi:hypothetical protein